MHISKRSMNSGRFVAKEADATGYGGGFRYDGNTNTVIFGIVSNVDKDVIFILEAVLRLNLKQMALNA